MSFNRFYKYNIDCKESKKQITAFINENILYYSNFEIRCLALKEEEKWINGICVITGYPINFELKKRKSHYYENVHLLEQCIEKENILSFLDELKNEKIKIDNDEVIIGTRAIFSESMYLAKNNAYSKFPGYLFESHPSLDINRSFDFTQLLLSSNYPFYSNVNHAVEEWLGISDFKGNNDARLNKILLFIPQCKAYFESIKYDLDNNILQIKIESQDDFGPFFVKVSFQGESGFISIHQELTKTKSSLEIDTNMVRNLDRFEIYLIDKDDKIYDYHIEDRYKVEGGERVFGKTIELETEKIIENAIECGENVNFEFKPYIKKGDQKINEIFRTVIAFANTYGGYILMGIDKYIQIEGISQGLESDFRGLSFDKMLDKYSGYLQSEINNILNKSLSVKILTHKYSGRTVLIVEVPEGKNKPYMNSRTNEIYIRRGANNYRPNEEELSSLFSRISIF